jgi:hypothetical protein
MLAVLKEFLGVNCVYFSHLHMSQGDTPTMETAPLKRRSVSTRQHRRGQ